mmetsp:Transcript_19444/g.45249  ORF Transcript_19444/g.45249 Transcript_19444/m.45249 type:complete len:104 (-) Transcript_19444:347-658(-)
MHAREEEQPPPQHELLIRNLTCSPPSTVQVQLGSLHKAAVTVAATSASTARHIVLNVQLSHLSAPHPPRPPSPQCQSAKLHEQVRFCGCEGNVGKHSHSSPFG